MTIPRKKSRPIEVNGRQYRWMVKPKKPKEKGWVRVTIEDQETGEIQQVDRRGFMSALTRVSPMDVREIILTQFGLMG